MLYAELTLEVAECQYNQFVAIRGSPSFADWVGYSVSLAPATAPHNQPTIAALPVAAGVTPEDTAREAPRLGRRNDMNNDEATELQLEDEPVELDELMLEWEGGFWLEWRAGVADDLTEFLAKQEQEWLDERWMSDQTRGDLREFMDKRLRECLTEQVEFVDGKLLVCREEQDEEDPDWPLRA